MKHQFTAAARRAIVQAAGWSTREDRQELETPALLLGLLVEAECRAAITLAEHGINAQVVRRRWPGLQRLEVGAPNRHEQDICVGGAAGEPPSVPPFSAELEASLAAVAERLHSHPRPLTLATEHLLLGLAAAEHEVAGWLREQGVDPDALEAEIQGRYGVSASSLPLQDEGLEEASTAVQESGAAAVPRSRREETPSASARPTSESPGALPPEPQVPLLRVVDAAANRGLEGLRVVEDYIRFVLDDRHLTVQMKRLRHDLTGLLSRVPIGRRLAARETQADVGTSIAAASERRRQDLGHVLAANFTRLQESLRTLEEFGKLLDPALAAELEQLRYRTYTVQRAVEMTRGSLERLSRVRLYVLIDGRASEQQFAQLARSLVDAGVHAVQLRDKSLDDRRLLGRARLLRQITLSGGALFIINDRPDLAVLARADGVHVGQQELTVKDVRTLVGPDALVGVSTHSIEQARQAVLDGANYVGVGPTFPSGTKHFDEFPGPELLRAVASEIRLPAFAIGGITRHNVADVLAAGFSRIAVSGAVTGADDPAAAVRELLAVLGRAEAGSHNPPGDDADC